MVETGNSKNTSDPEASGFSIKHLDTSVDPVEDFFHYTSGTWLKNNPIPADKSSWNSFSELMESNNLKLKGILESCRDGTSGGMVEKMLGDFYTSSLDTERLEKLRFTPIEEFMDRISDMASREELLDTVAYLHLNGVFPFFEISSKTDEKNSSVYGLYLDQGGIALPDRDYYLTEEFSEILKKYQSHIGKMFSIYGFSEEDALKAAATVVAVETEIASASRSRTDLRDAEKNYNRIPFSDLGKRFPDLGLNRYSKLVEIPEIEYVIIGQPEFFEFLNSNAIGKSLDDLKLYLKWQVLNSAAEFLFSEIQEEHFEMFGRNILGQKEQEPRWKRAIRVIDQQVGEALGELYVRKYFDSDARKRMAEMVDDIKEVFLDRLKTLGWMTEETRQKAIAKFGKFRTKIGHPDKFRDYSTVEIRSDDYFGNVCRSASFDMKRQIRRAGKPVDKGEWWMTPSTVNAYFSPPDNEIVFPAGILQPPFFDASMDIAVNYGAIGSVISHEITHGYDDQGRKYDEDGNIKDWWTREDEENFTSRAKEVVEMYGSMEVLPGLKVNGELTLGENIADFGGVSIAYEALQKRLRKEPGLRREIDGLTPEQRFFISYGQIWRQNIREPLARLLVTVDPHAPNRLRATLPVYSHAGFEKAISPLSKQEKPVVRKKVEIW